MKVKVCKLCKGKKSIDDFYTVKRSADGRDAHCKLCNNQERRRVRAEKEAGVFVNRCRKPRLTMEQKAARAAATPIYMLKYRQDNAETLAARKRADNVQAKAEGIAHYGGNCSCCGESRVEFLTMEHILGRDKSRKKRTGKIAWLHAKRQGWPVDVTVHCFNCNSSKGAFGYCPHDIERIRAVAA